MTGDIRDPAAAMKQRAASYAAEMVQDGMLVGLGSGSTSTLMVRALAERARGGLGFIGVPTSEAIANLATSLGLQIASIDDQPRLDLTIDGADEVDPQLNLVKGLGGALLREKIVASAASRFAIIVDERKLVQRLGTRSPIPVEIVPFGWRRTSIEIEALGARPERRVLDGQPYVTDGGHYIVDCHVGPLEDPARLAASIKALTGVVEHGLFLSMATTVIVGYAERVDVLTRERS
jgi:ribose 5-phosphate isomerase A